MLEERARLDALGVNPERQRALDAKIAKIETLREANPMLGHRGCRLGITYPEIYGMQVRAIMEAACTVAAAGVTVEPEIMIPLTGTVGEMQLTYAQTKKVADGIIAEMGVPLKYSIGTMIEVPRAALLADKIARTAEFFSFGTNDLTQMTFGYSRDDVAKFLPEYLQKPLLKIFREEFRHIVTAVPERHLREVVGAEREELRGPRDLVGEQRRPRHLDHGPDRVLQRDAHLRDDAVGDLLCLGVGELHLADGAGERNHDLGLDRHARGRHGARRLHDRAHLHPVDLGVRDPEAAAAMAQHRVGLAQRFDLRDLRVESALALGVHAERVETGALLEHLFVFLRRREELVERRGAAEGP